METRKVKRTRLAAGTGFFDYPGPVSTPVEIGGHQIGLPFHKYDGTAFMGVFPAPIEAARRLLPSPRLFPVRLGARTAAVGVMALRYDRFAVKVDGRYELVTPYGEVGVAIACTYGRPAPRVLPLLEVSDRQPLQLGFYVVYLPVTARESRDRERALLGLPMFVSDIRFREEGDRRVARLEEHGRHILTLTVREGGLAQLDRAPMHIYTERDGRLARIDMPLRGYAHRRILGQPATLELGDHPVAEVLRDVGVSTVGTMSRSFKRLQMVVPAPVVLDDPAERVESYMGSDLERGRYTLAYDDRMVIDLYGELPPVERMGAPVEAPPANVPSTEPEIRA